jgi:transposase
LEGVTMVTKKINESTRQKIIKGHASGQSMRKIAKEFGIGLASVHRIVKESELQKDQTKAAKKTISSEKQKRIQELEKRIAELEKKIADLKVKKS